MNPYPPSLSRGKPPTKASSDVTSAVSAAVALQDHLTRTLSLGTRLGPRLVPLGPAARAQKKKVVRSVIDTGRAKPKAQRKNEPAEYVLDPKPPKPTLAQKMGLVEGPQQLLSESDWLEVKARSNRRDDSKQPCVICKEDFGLQEQVLLSCTHVFHRACLQSFERFTGKKTCPMCRKEQYQTRVIHEGKKEYRVKCATVIQAVWRGYVVRCWYYKLRQTVPPKDPGLRKKFYEQRLHDITDRMIRSCDFNVNVFLTEIDRNLEASRDVFKTFDSMFKQLSDDDWEAIQITAVERGQLDCPICLMPLTGHGMGGDTPRQSPPKAGRAKTPQGTPVPASQAPSKVRETVLCSCSHVFHHTCLSTLEDLAMNSVRNSCPVCRTVYQKRVICI